jgi:UDP-2,3-diacylglucosamine pyrophosphatase LpxH
MKFEYRTVFISDSHLGFSAIRAEELSAFLKHVRCDRLYLVGDIIDLWALRSKWRWPAMHNQVVRRILKIAKRGTTVTYVPGNHDDALRQYIGLDLGGVRLAKQAVHRTADGRSLLITHGDEYDLVVHHSRFLSMLGAWAYDHLITLNRAVDSVRAVFGFKRWSFSQAIKLRVKAACTFVSKFETALLAEADRRGLDGVICGHVHQPEIRDVEINGRTRLYANCGDWIERATALVEHDDGRLELIDVATLLADAGIEINTINHDAVPLDPDAALPPTVPVSLPVITSSLLPAEQLAW